QNTTEDYFYSYVFFFQAEDGIRDFHVTGVQTCALPISMRKRHKDVQSPRGGMILALMGLAMMTLVGCSHTSQEVSKASSSDWQMPDDPEAARYFAGCKDDFHRASQTFSALESHPGYSDPRALLNAINELDIQLDAPLSGTSLYSNVHPNAALRDAAQTCQQRFVALLGDISLSRPLYNHLAKV